MVWLITLLLSHASPTALNEWACNTVISKYNRDLDGGCYDICFAIAGGKYDATTGEFTGGDDIPLSEPHELQNACAIVMHGGEY